MSTALAAYLDGAASARRYIRGYLALAPAGPHSEVMRLADAMLDPDRAGSIDVPKLVDTLPPEVLCQTSRVLRHAADSTEMALRIATALASRGSDTAGGHHDAACAATQVLDALQFRGHLRAAQRLTSLQLHWLRPTVMYNLTRAHMVPVDSSRAEFQRVLALAPRTTMTRLYSWWATDGDTAAIQTYLKDFANAQRRSRTRSGAAMLRADIASGRAFLALAKGDSVSAVTQLLVTADTLHECWYENRMALVQLLAAAGRYREAATRLERRWPGTMTCSNGFDDVIWTMERARVFDHLGRRDEAAANYAFVAEAWRTADPELQPYVRESRAAIARLETARR
jgi:hypothetical protein